MTFVQKEPMPKGNLCLYVSYDYGQPMPIGIYAYE